MRAVFRGGLPSVNGQAGMALMPIVLTVVIAGALIGAGMQLVGPATRRMQIQSARLILERASRSVVAWSMAKGHLPTAAEFSTAAGVRRDPWGRALVYVYDGDLAGGAGLCGRETTGLVADGSAGTAFVIASAGPDLHVDSTPGTSGAHRGNAVISSLDLSEVVSLERLRNQAGCFDRTAGRLTILNGEMPAGRIAVPYRGDLFAEGGVPPYAWTATGLPAWMTLTPAGVSCRGDGTPSSPGTYSLSVTLSDSAGSAVRRRFDIEIE